MLFRLSAFVNPELAAFSAKMQAYSAFSIEPVLPSCRETVTALSNRYFESLASENACVLTLQVTFARLFSGSLIGSPVSGSAWLRIMRSQNHQFSETT